MNSFTSGALLGFTTGVVMATTLTISFVSNRGATEIARNAPAAPTQAEADAAFKRSKSDQWSLILGECSADRSGSGVMCAVDYKQRPDAVARQGLINFTLGPSGWMAVHYY